MTDTNIPQPGRSFSSKKFKTAERTSKKYGWRPGDFGARNFDNDLINKIYDFQEKHELKADGIAGLGTTIKLLDLNPQLKDTLNLDTIEKIVRDRKPGRLKTYALRVLDKTVRPSAPGPADDFVGPGQEASLVKKMDRPPAGPAAMKRLKLQFGDFYTEEQLQELASTAHKLKERPEIYIAKRVSQALSDMEENITSARGASTLKRFAPVGNITVFDPRKAYINPQIIPWLEGLANVGKGVWRIGDMSLPFGGKPKDYAKGSFLRGQREHSPGLPNTKSGRTRFNHDSHRFGTDVDINLPLKDRLSNEWNENITDSNKLNEEELFRLIKYYNSHPLKYIALINPKHRNHMLSWAKKKFGGESSEEYKMIEKVLRSWKGHWDHVHLRFRRPGRGKAGGWGEKFKKWKAALASARRALNAQPATAMVASADRPAGGGPTRIPPDVPGAPRSPLKENISQRDLLQTLFALISEVEKEV